MNFKWNIDLQIAIMLLLWLQADTLGGSDNRCHTGSNILRRVMDTEGVINLKQVEEAKKTSFMWYLIF